MLDGLELRERLAELLARLEVGGGRAEELMRRAEGVGREQHAARVDEPRRVGESQGLGRRVLEIERGERSAAV